MKKSQQPQLAPTALNVKGVGEQTQKKLSRLGIMSLTDMLMHLPLRYQNRTRLTTVRRSRVGQEILIEGEITSVQMPKGGRTKLLVLLKDESGFIYLRFFHVFPQQKNVLRVGVRLRCFGEMRLGKDGLEMAHPEWVVLSQEKPQPLETALTPIYPTTEGVSQYMLRKLSQTALMQLSQFTEMLPESLLKNLNFPTLQEAFIGVHRPDASVSIEALLQNKTPAQQRLAFEELLAHRLSLLQTKSSFQRVNAMALPPAPALTEKFLTGLPFALTSAQARVIEEISVDLQNPHPMLRLVQGDVGSGKTVVAALAMLPAINQGLQVALMAPTELLAEQHAKTLARWFEPLGITICYLSGSLKGSARKSAETMLASGESFVAVGTHALFQAGVQFKQLALVIVDEQHRFGVQQRSLFREKGAVNNLYPHQLMMTATPIPRTLAMSLYADLDVSVIDELPPGRTPITTIVVPDSRRSEVIARVRHACLAGRQVYWVCPLIEESDVLSSQAATTMAQQLHDALGDFTVDLIHGRQSSKDKETAMRLFKEGKTQVLVATTVIEVGVDVPNASVMVIENAERMGLSQLHQLRGRVGRGSVESFCVLMAQSPVSRMGQARLTVMRETNDGFKIAEKDLELRGPGEMLGTRQTGDLNFRIADLMRDAALLEPVQQAAKIMQQEAPDNIPLLLKRWLPNAERYSEV